jgi:hypothetical protein
MNGIISFVGKLLLVYVGSYVLCWTSAALALEAFHPGPPDDVSETKEEAQERRKKASVARRIAWQWATITSVIWILYLCLLERGELPDY